MELVGQFNCLLMIGAALNDERGLIRWSLYKWVFFICNLLLCILNTFYRNLYASTCTGDELWRGANTVLRCASGDEPGTLGGLPPVRSIHAWNNELNGQISAWFLCTIRGIIETGGIPNGPVLKWDRSGTIWKVQIRFLFTLSELWCVKNIFWFFVGVV